MNCYVYVIVRQCILYCILPMYITLLANYFKIKICEVIILHGTISSTSTLDFHLPTYCFVFNYKNNNLSARAAFAYADFIIHVFIFFIFSNITILLFYFFSAIILNIDCTQHCAKNWIYAIVYFAYISSLRIKNPTCGMNQFRTVHISSILNRITCA